AMQGEDDFMQDSNKCSATERLAVFQRGEEEGDEGQDELNLEALNAQIILKGDQGTKEGFLIPHRVEVYEQWRMEALEEENPEKLLLILNQLNTDAFSHNLRALKKEGPEEWVKSLSELRE